MKTIPTFVEFWKTVKVIQQANINNSTNSGLWFVILIVMIRILQETIQKLAQIQQSKTRNGKEMHKHMKSLFLLILFVLR